MTHKLGCGDNPWIYYCICDELEAAYQRGREDAAKALIDLPASAWGENLSPLDIEAILAAARGDGEQA